MSYEVLPRFVRIRPAPEVIAVVHRRDGAFERQYLQSVTRQLEIANDLRSQQADHVRKDRKLETRKNFLGYCGSADEMAALEHDNLAPGAGEVRRRNESIVTAAHDDHVIALRHWRFRGGSKNGSFVTVAPA